MKRIYTYLNACRGTEINLGHLHSSMVELSHTLQGAQHPWSLPTEYYHLFWSCDHKNLPPRESAALPHLENHHPKG